MGFLDNAVNKSVPQGSSLAKPLLLAFGALLASGALTRKQAPTPAPGPSPAGIGAPSGVSCLGFTFVATCLKNSSVRSRLTFN